MAKARRKSWAGSKAAVNAPQSRRFAQFEGVRQGSKRALASLILRMAAAGPIESE